jgi:hypothetical protein
MWLTRHPLARHLAPLLAQLGPGAAGAAGAPGAPDAADAADAAQTDDDFVVAPASRRRVG